MIPSAIGAAAAALLAAAPAMEDSGTAPGTARGELRLFAEVGYAGERMALDYPRRAMRTGWSIGSLAIHPGDRWLVCARTRYRGPCVILDRSLQDASMIDIGGPIRSAQRLSERAPIGAATPNLAPDQPRRQPGT